MANRALDNPKDVNPELREAIASYTSSRSEDDLKTVYYYLSKKSFLLASNFVGQERTPGLDNISEQEVSIRTARNQSGEEAMMAFTDTQALIATCGEDARYLTVDANTLLNMVLGQSLAGLVVNPSGPSIFFGNQELTNIKQQEQRPASFTRASIAPEDVQNQALVEAIDKLMADPSQDSQAQFQRVLWGSILLLPMESDGNNMYVTTLTTTDGKGGFPVFTDHFASLALKRELQLVPFSFEAVLAMAVQYPCELFVINPGSAAQLELAMDSMRQLYQLSRQAGVQGSPLAT